MGKRVEVIEPILRYRILFGYTRQPNPSRGGLAAADVFPIPCTGVNRYRVPFVEMGNDL